MLCVDRSPSYPHRKDGGEEWWESWSFCWGLWMHRRSRRWMFLQFSTVSRIRLSFFPFPSFPSTFTSNQWFWTTSLFLLNIFHHGKLSFIPQHHLVPISFCTLSCIYIHIYTYLSMGFYSHAVSTNFSGTAVLFIRLSQHFKWLLFTSLTIKYQTSKKWLQSTVRSLKKTTRWSIQLWSFLWIMAVPYPSKIVAWL